MTELISNPIRIPCGGFDIDNDTLYFQNDVLKSKREDPELPSVSATDNGDVLTVVEGEWAKAAPSDDLPEVTASDNGDVLTVVDGAWAKAAPSGGSGALIVHVSSENIDDAIRYTLDKTAREIIAAMPLAYVEATTESQEGTMHLYFPVGNNVSSYGETSDSYVFPAYIFELNQSRAFIAETLDDYPFYMGEK